MAPEQNVRSVRIVCDECNFSKEVTKNGEKSAEVIREHGRETGHKLSVEDPDDAA
ncbi:hypothetical protein [Natrinema sp. DC36]|uniref:hypothetical protein n=1 Tax=Natrinema sp. DC36 TaxID=2878680 RepID=UPI001CEFEA5F|nr:hypothetical protein [Natrinema sp. DC36]